jgi:PIN domain nuclease of toxin-antitoxin system
VKLLLDTHTFLWFVTNDPSLSVPVVSADAALDAYGVNRLW